MTTKHIEVEAEVDTCEFCGAERFYNLRTPDGTQFDRRDRAFSFNALRLWPAHPYHDKSCCDQCYDAGKFKVEGIPERPSGCTLARLYEVYDCSDCGGKGCKGCQGGKHYGDDGKGLRLPEKPITEWERIPRCGLVIAPGGRRALLCTTHSSYVVPVGAGDWSDTMTLHLQHGDTYIVCYDDGTSTGWRTVREIKFARHVPVADLVSSGYPAWTRERAGEDEALEVNLWEPVESLE